MSRRNVVSFYTAPARSGKTFRIVVRICDEILPLTDGVVYTNLPLYREKIAEYCRDRHGLDYDEVIARLHVIPRDIEHSWRDAGNPIYDEKTGRKTGMHPLVGPWEYFADKELSGSTVIIDEIHNFCGSIGTPKPVSNQWQKWLGELGHNQAVFLCVSQSPEKVHSCIKQEAQASYLIRNTGLDRDPYFKIEVYDWMELWSGLFGMEYRIFVFEQEVQKSEGRRKKGQRKLQLMGPPYFDFYDSFNKPIASEQTANVSAFEHEYEKHLRKGPLRGRLSLLWWFFVKNMQALVSRGLIVAALLAFLVFLGSGGAGDVAGYIARGVGGSFTGGEKKEAPPPEPAPPLIGPDGEPVDMRDVELVRRVYEHELRVALVERELLAAELEAAREELKRGDAIVLVTPEKMVFRRGHEYGIGDEIQSGEYRGRVLLAINYRRREAVLDDGTVLGLVGDRVPEGKSGGSDDAGRAGVHPVLPSAGGTAGGAGGAAGGEKGNAVDVRNDVKRISSLRGG